MIETDFNLNNRRKTSLQDLRQEITTLNPEMPIKVGRSPVVVADQSGKSVRKVEGILERLKETGILKNGFIVRSQNGLPIKHETTGTVYINTEPNGNGIQFIHARVLAQKQSGIYDWLGADSIKIEDKVSIITGNCLFGSKAALAVGESGESYSLTDTDLNKEDIKEKICGLRIYKNLQPYEADSILRLSGLVSNLNPNTIGSIAMATPRMEYYLYAMDLYEMGLMDNNLMLEWFSEVDKRAKGINRLVSKRLDKNLNLNQPVTTVTPLASIEETVKEGVRKNRKGLLSELIERLSSGDILWRKLLECAEKPVSSYQDLNNLSYVMGYLRQLETSDKPLVVVENVEEAAILNKTSKLIQQIKEQVLIIGLYVHSNVILSQEHESPSGIRALYFYDSKDKYQSAMEHVLRMNR